MNLRLTDRKHQAILEAAMQEFRNAGYELTSMDRIAAAASVSKRTVYNHFPSKEKLFAEILVYLWEKSSSSTEFTYKRDVSLQVQLVTLLSKKMELLADNAFLDLARMAMAELIHHPERAQDIVCRMNEKEGGLGGWIRAAIDDGKLKSVDADFAASQIEGLVKTFAFWPQVTMAFPVPSPEERRRIAESAADMFLNYYRRTDDRS